MEAYGVSLERGSSVKEKMAGPTFTKAKSSSNSTRKHEKMEINKIYTENCLETMAMMPDGFVDSWALVLQQRWPS